MSKEYNLIPFAEITEDARQIAVAWVEGFEPMGFDIKSKHKLASDIMNCSNQQLSEYKRKLKEELSKDVRGTIVLYNHDEILTLIDTI